MLDPNLLLQYRYSETKEDHGKRTGYEVQLSYYIGLHIKDAELLLKIRSFFNGVGNIYYDYNKNIIHFIVKNSKEINDIIIPHFKKYPLITQKAADFILFEQIVELMHEGAHITIDGLQQIINIKASMNLGISETIKSEFNQTKPVKRTIIQTTNIPNPNWITGFVSGEGNFDAGIRKSTNIVGSRVYLRFRLTQHTRDTQLMELIIKYLGVGRLEKDSRNLVVTIAVGNFSNLTEIIIPFSNQYPILGIKHLDYQDWCKIANLISQGSHLTIEGFEEIRVIEAIMNQGRKNKKII